MLGAVNACRMGFPTQLSAWNGVVCGTAPWVCATFVPHFSPLVILRLCILGVGFHPLGKGVRGFALPTLEHVTVDVDGDADAGVAQPLGSNDGIVPVLLQHHGSVEVPQAAQGDPGATGLFGEALHGVGQSVGMAPFLQVLSWEDHFRRLDAQLSGQFDLARPVLAQHGDGEVI